MENKVNLDSLFQESKKEFEKQKINNEDLKIIEDCIKVMTKESISKCISMLVDRLVEMKDQEKELSNEIYFQLGYDAGAKENEEKPQNQF